MTDRFISTQRCTACYLWALYNSKYSLHDSHIFFHHDWFDM